MKKHRVSFECKECSETVRAYVFPGALIACPECKAIYLVGLEGDTYSIQENTKSSKKAKK